MNTTTRLDLNHFALALGTLFLCVSVVHATVWPSDPDGVTINNKSCDAQAGPPGANGNCTYPLGTCYLVSSDPALDALTAMDYFKTSETRAWGYCSAGSVGGFQCTRYPAFTCAHIQFFEARSDSGVCQRLRSGIWITVGADACDPGVGGPD